MGEKLVSRETDSLTTGHICAATTTLATPGQGDVYCEGLLVARKGDPTVAHPFPPSPPCAPHVANVNIGSPTVYCHGEKVTFVTASADLGGMTGSNTTVWVATNAQAIAEALGVELFAPKFPEFPDIPDAVAAETYAAEVIEGRLIEEAAGVDPDQNELGEYGDGGIPTSRFNNTSPTTGETGPINTPEDSSSPNPPADNSEWVVFLSHVDPRIKPELRAMLERIAQRINSQITITSGYRDPGYNTQVGGVKRSQHMEGNAVDVSMTGFGTTARQEFIQVAYEEGIRGIGIYNTFTHIDIGPKRAWGPNGSRNTLPRYPWAQAVLGPLGYATS